MCRLSIKFFSDRIFKGYQQARASIGVDSAAQEDDGMKNGKEFEKAGLLHALSGVVALTRFTSCQVNIVEPLRSHERVLCFSCGTKER